MEPKMIVVFYKNKRRYQLPDHIFKTRHIVDSKRRFNPPKGDNLPAIYWRTKRDTPVQVVGIVKVNTPQDLKQRKQKKGPGWAYPGPAQNLSLTG